MLFAGMVRGFEVRTDLFECEPRGFELSARIKNGLVRVVLALRISAGAEGVDGESADAGSKLDDADVCSAGHAVTTLLSTLRCGVKREDRTIITVNTPHSKARF